MAIKHDTSLIKEQFELLLADAIVRVKTEEDPHVLNEYKKLFKKNVPLSLRSYVAAFLTKGIITETVNAPSKYRRPGKRNDERFSGRFSRRDERQSGSFSRSKGDYKDNGKPSERESTPHVSIAEDKAASIFISVGRNRGVYVRDIVGLVSQRGLIERERIGDIRVLDNYSFVQVYLEDADNLIALLNGTDYRNRKLTVSYAHKRDKNDEFGKDFTSDTSDSLPHASEEIEN
ncbi:MAG: DbpA RNA binding domain-containing protein [Spirochaetales bacterium]